MIKQFWLTAGRRINRPTYQDLNPFEYIYDNYTKERGNPCCCRSLVTMLNWIMFGQLNKYGGWLQPNC